MGNYLRKIVNLAMLTVLVMAAVTVQAFPYELGDYKVDVTVRNAAMNLVAGIKVALYRYDKATILVEAAAAGYKTLTYKLPVRENQFVYKIDLVLADLARRVHIVNHNNKIIASAYVRLEQYGFPSDHYGITAFIPVKEWPVAAAARVEIFDSMWGVPLKKTCEITQVDEFYCVKLSMTRKSLKWTGKDLMVTFRTTAPASPAAVMSRVGTLEKIVAGDAYPAGCEESLAEYLCSNFTPEDLESGQVALPSSLAKLMQARARFAEAHRENLENF
jgi:hypothetical protein